MFRRWTFPVMGGKATFARHGDYLGGADDAVVASAAKALSRLDDVLWSRLDRDGNGRQELTQMLIACGYGPNDLLRASIDELAAMTRDLVRIQSLRLLLDEPEDDRGGGGGPPPPEPPEPPKPPPPKPPPKPKARIGVEVRFSDDTAYTGRCLIKLADGTEQETVLNADGTLELDGILPGDCEISFPDLESDEWEPA